jgi:CheY-like chemotaxis protein
MPIESSGLQSIASERRHDEILVVDDTPADLVAITAVLDPLGVRVVTAASGEAALQLLLERDFPLVLLDVYVPTMSSFELAQPIVADAPLQRL